MAKTKRTALSKKLRFEVFKRDSFKCQYCGKSAPDVILHVDHIMPVSKGGTNEILNLITACAECNGGKSAVLLSDDSAIKKQKQQLDELNKRREQLEMMMEWRNGLAQEENSILEFVCDRFCEAFNVSLTPHGESTIRGQIKLFGMDEVLEAIAITCSKNITGEKIINYMAGVCWNRKRGTKPGARKWRA